MTFWLLIWNVKQADSRFNFWGALGIFWDAQYLFVGSLLAPWRHFGGLQGFFWSSLLACQIETWMRFFHVSSFWADLGVCLDARGFCLFFFAVWRLKVSLHGLFLKSLSASQIKRERGSLTFQFFKQSGYLFGRHDPLFRSPFGPLGSLCGPPFLFWAAF